MPFDRAQGWVHWKEKRKKPSIRDIITLFATFICTAGSGLSIAIVFSQGLIYGLVIISVLAVLIVLHRHDIISKEWGNRLLVLFAVALMFASLIILVNHSMPNLTAPSFFE